MFEVGFGELILIACLALVVLGPERLPKVAQQVGRWVGRARSMARQFREQLEEEVNIEQPKASPRRPHTESSQSYSPPPPPAAAESDPAPASQTQAGTQSGVPDWNPPPPAAPTSDDHFSHTHGDGEATPVSEPEAPPLPPGDPVPETAAARSEHERGT